MEGDQGSRLMEFLKTITNEMRAKELYENCKKEKISDVALLQKVSEENLRVMGFAVGEVTAVKTAKSFSASQIEEAIADIKCKYFQRESQSPTTVEKTKPKKLKVDEEKEIILHIGLKKRVKGEKRRRLTKRGGGGLTEIKLLKKDTSYHNIISQAKYLFQKEASEATLELNGKEISGFYDTDGNECTFAYHLKCQRMYSSRCRLYLITNDDEEEHDATFTSSNTQSCNESQTVENFECKTLLPDSINIVYSKKTETSDIHHFGKVSVIEAESCKNPDILTASYGEINPLDFGYTIMRISKGSKTFVDKLQMENCSISAHVLLHGPEEINGYDISDYVIGVIVKDSVKNPTVEWLLDGEVYQSGENLFIINVTKPGLYYANIIHQEVHFTSNAVCIVQISGIFRVGHVVDLMNITKNISTESNEMPFEHVPTATPDASDHEQQLQSDVPSILSTDFQVGEEIGKGNYGTVYKGSWLGSVVAIKKLPLSKKGKNAQLNVIKKEIEILSRLRHPNLIQVMAYCIEATKAMIIMEYMEGCDLDDIIFPEGNPKIQLSEESKLSVFLQISKGLAYLHGQKHPIIHQDIKPSNILVSNNNLVKICDLGVSRLRTMQTKASCTTLKNLAGTPVYMAPECLLKEAQSTPSSDIWSMGCTVIEMYTSHDVWDLATDDDSDMEQLIDLLKQKKPPQALEYVPSSVPVQIIDLIKKCLSYSQMERPAAVDLIEKINHFVAKCGRCCNK